MFLKLITLLTISAEIANVFSANITIRVNNMPEEAETLAVSTVLIDIQSGLTLNAISDRLVTHFVTQYGGQWFSMISTAPFVSTIEAEPHSVLWFSYDNVNIVLFRPSIQTETELLYGARLSSNNITIVSSEMTDTLEGQVISIAFAAIKAYNTFNTAAKYVSDTLDTTYGPDWQCIVGQKGFDSHTQHISGSYLDFTVNDLQVVVFQTIINNNTSLNTTGNTSIIQNAINATEVVDTNNNLIVENVTAIVEIIRRAFNLSVSVCTQQVLLQNAKQCYNTVANFVKPSLNLLYRTVGWSVSVGDASSFANSDNYLKITFGKLLVVLNKLKL